ncbi:MAG TPA: helix-turn-helix transcriptional regulator [Clostridia bacterium]|nr:helix-turn-helix transcriptional regulator [Clostridia bacterium]
MRLNERQKKIIEIVKERGPITGSNIAQELNLTRAALRPDLSILTRSGILEARPRVGYYYTGDKRQSLIAETIKNIRVKDVKSIPIVIDEKTSVYDAVVTMFTEDVGTLFVVGDEGVLEGVVSRKDFLKIALGGSDLHSIPVNVIMTRMPNVITTTNEETVYMAAKKIIDREIDSLPVVRTFIDSKGNEHLEVIGRITKTNLARLFVELGEGKN